jgi:lipoate-protein ligase A
MRIDEALLDHAIGEAQHLPFLRIYRWDRPALSLGVHQRPSDELLHRCAELGVEVVRRPTGGSAVLHGTDLTYAVVALRGAMGVMEAYRWVAGGLIEGFARLGIEARVGGRRSAGAAPEPPSARSACFAATLGADLEVAGAKICGSAQVRLGGWFLQHGSIPLSENRSLTRRILRHSGPNTSTCMDELRPGISWDELAGCLVEGFRSRWGSSGRLELEDVFACAERTG